MKRFSIRDIEAVTGIKSHTIRIWEQRYGIIKPKRTDTNIRFYDDQDLRLLLNISILNDKGFKISEIAKFSEKEISEKVRIILSSQQSFSSQVKTLVTYMLTLDEMSFSRQVNNFIIQYGMEEAMTGIIFPFLHEVGILWQVGSIHPAHEHFISNLIKQKLYIAIDGQTGKLKEPAKRFLLFLPQEEMHEIGLLFANYLLRSKGQEVIYLGQKLPEENLQEIFDMYKPDVIFTTITTGIIQGSPQHYINALSSWWPSSKILVSGNEVIDKDLSYPGNVTRINNLQEFLDQIPS